MKTKIVASKAGIAAAGMVHTGFLPKGGIIHPLALLFVGSNFNGMSSLGVLTPNAKSTPTITMILIKMAKSEITERTCCGKDTNKFRLLKLDITSLLRKHRINYFPRGFKMF